MLDKILLVRNDEWVNSKNGFLPIIVFIVFFLIISVVLIAILVLRPAAVPKEITRDEKKAIFLEAARTKDPSICKKLVYADDRHECVVNTGLPFTTEFCTNIVSSENNSCYMLSAKSLKDYRSCDAIVHKQDHDSCLYQLAVIMKDSSVCDHIKGDSTMYDACLVRVGKEKRNISVCEQIKTTDSSQTCIQSFFRDVSDTPSLCEQLSTPQLRSLCFALKQSPSSTILPTPTGGIYTYCCRIRYTCPNNSEIVTYLTNDARNKDRMTQFSAGSCVFVGYRDSLTTSDYRDEKCTEVWDPKEACSENP